MSFLDKQMISIGMPVYNGEKYIKEALDSLLSQTYRDFELIISDNASTDSTQSICESYAIKDKRIRYIRQKNNIGPAANFKYVLDQASSEYFMWAAHDDIWSNNWIEVLLDELIKNRLAVGVYGQLIHIDEESNVYNHKANNKNLNYKGALRKLAYYIEPESLGKANLFYSIFRKKILKNLDLNSMEYDFQGLYYLLSYGCFIQNEKAFLRKRLHAESLAPFFKDVATYPKVSLIKRVLYRLLYTKFDHNFLLKTYLIKSSFLLKIFLVLLYPIKIIYICVS